MRRDEKYYTAVNQVHIKPDPLVPHSLRSVQEWWSGEQKSTWKNERKNRKIAESTLQHDEECTSEDAIASVDTMSHVDHDDVIDVGVAA
jgi:hypothetical protein